MFEKDQLFINNLETNISQQVQDVSTKIEDYAIPKKETTSNIDELKDQNVPLPISSKKIAER